MLKLTKSKIDKFINQYGSNVRLSTTEENISDYFKAFVQPLRYKNKMYLDGVRSRAGYIDQSHYLYIGPSNVEVWDFDDNLRLHMHGAEFFFVKKEKVVVSGEVIYNWAILRSVVKETQDDQI